MAAYSRGILPDESVLVSARRVAGAWADMEYECFRFDEAADAARKRRQRLKNPPPMPTDEQARSPGAGPQAQAPAAPLRSASALGCVSRLACRLDALSARLRQQARPALEAALCAWGRFSATTDLSAEEREYLDCILANYMPS